MTCLAGCAGDRAEERGSSPISNPSSHRHHYVTNDRASRGHRNSLLLLEQTGDGRFVGRSGQRLSPSALLCSYGCSLSRPPSCSAPGYSLPRQIRVIFVGSTACGRDGGRERTRPSHDAYARILLDRTHFLAVFPSCSRLPPLPSLAYRELRQ
jgi:hypothetical protein